jgi:hypothetical protein
LADFSDRRGHLSREVFSRFKTFADHEANVPMTALLIQIWDAASQYRRITEAAENDTGPINRPGLFAYRMKAMESDVMKSVLLALLNNDHPPIAGDTMDATLDVIESWLTRRMLVRATTKSYGQGGCRTGRNRPTFRG